MDFFSTLTHNSAEMLPVFVVRTALIVNSAKVFREYVDIVPTIVDDTLSCEPFIGRRQEESGYLYVYKSQSRYKLLAYSDFDLIGCGERGI